MRPAKVLYLIDRLDVPYIRYLTEISSGRELTGCHPKRCGVVVSDLTRPNDDSCCNLL